MTSPLIISSVKDVIGAGAQGGAERPGGAEAQGRAERAGGAQALAADLLAAVSAIRRIARRAARHAWQQQPLPPAQSELLRLAAARPGISVADAAHELRLAPNTVSTLVGRLAAEGLLNRGRVTTDGRSVRLTVTDKATQRIAEWRDLRADLTVRALDRLPASDLATLADAIPALLRLAAELDERYLEGAGAERPEERGEGLAG
jgi:DNA-binding MarR family transcriptional regulator